MTEIPSRHQQFKARVTALVDEMHRITSEEFPGVNRTTALANWHNTRTLLMIEGLHEITRGGHGMTWAKTMLRLYE